MMIPWGDRPKTPSYKEYKSDKFKKNKDKIRLILSGIRETSLHKEDKIKLLNEIKKIVTEFEI